MPWGCRIRPKEAQQGLIRALSDHQRSSSHHGCPSRGRVVGPRQSDHAVSEEEITSTFCCGNASPEDEHLLADIVAIDADIIEWLERRERRRKEKQERQCRSR